eukprot:scpid69876/ scgid9450/ 
MMIELAVADRALMPHRAALLCLLLNLLTALNTSCVLVVRHVLFCRYTLSVVPISLPLYCPTVYTFLVERVEFLWSTPVQVASLYPTSRIVHVPAEPGTALCLYERVATSCRSCGRASNGKLSLFAAYHTEAQFIFF